MSCTGALVQNLIPNGNLELWDAGPVPREMDAQVNNTVITTLDEWDDLEQHPARHAWGDIAGSRSDKYTFEGRRALRATLAAGAAVDAFRLHPEGIAAAAWTGASTEQIKVYLSDGTPAPVEGHFYPGRYRFHFAARCSVDGNLLLGRVVLRSPADAVLFHLVNGLWAAADAAGRPTWGMRTRWQRFGVTFEVPLWDAGTPIAVENMVWQLSNGTAAVQVIDLDDIWIESLEPSMQNR